MEIAVKRLSDKYKRPIKCYNGRRMENPKYNRDHYKVVARMERRR
ncbi:MAG: hypothetical protein N3E47_06395 [Candidatus Bathyarchaeota archaeon]|nr:hypothetical protein [Candidatus Bathyarchaeota archaeon]